MSPLCTGRHVDQWESSDMSEQSRGGCAKSLRVFPPRSRRSLRFALSERRMHAEGHEFSRSRFIVRALRSLCGLCSSAVILILRMGFEARRNEEQAGMPVSLSECVGHVPALHWPTCRPVGKLRHVGAVRGGRRGRRWDLEDLGEGLGESGQWSSPGYRFPFRELSACHPRVSG